MLGAPYDLQPPFMGAHTTIAERHNNTFLDDGRTPSRLVVSVVVVMMVMMMVVVVVVILRQLGIGFSLRRLGVVHFLEEGKRVGDGLEQLREGLGL
jgi:Na+-transporting methylmalonyl-CoA/oxaloacetate decarboxylase beta subunit